MRIARNTRRCVHCEGHEESSLNLSITKQSAWCNGSRFWSVPRCNSGTRAIEVNEVFADKNGVLLFVPSTLIVLRLSQSISKNYRLRHVSLAIFAIAELLNAPDIVSGYRLICIVVCRRFTKIYLPREQVND